MKTDKWTTKLPNEHQTNHKELLKVKLKLPSEDLKAKTNYKTITKRGKTRKKPNLSQKYQINLIILPKQL